MLVNNMVTRQSILIKAKNYLNLRENTSQHTEMVNRYNSQNPLPVGYKLKTSDAWCQAWVTVVAMECNALGVIVPECGCARAVTKYKQMGQWENRSYSPLPGDIIYYDWNNDGVADHVGFVLSNDGNNLEVIEGNYNDAVGIRKIARNYKYILGYAVPKYDVTASNVASLVVPADHPDFSPEEFFELIKPYVIADMHSSGILASLTAAQALIESGRGNSSLARLYNNLFGMKKSTDWTGNAVNMPTTEYINGVATHVVASFKAYDNWSSSIADHSALFNKYDRYKLLRGEQDYKKACQYVQQAGYATSPTYTTTLTRIIEQYKLYEWDTETLKPISPIMPVIDIIPETYNIDGYVLHNIGYGSDGAEVIFLQSMLLACGYDVGPDGANGVFNETTNSALVQFMIDKQLVRASNPAWKYLITACS